MNLETYIANAIETRYHPGVHDCVTFLSGWVDGVSGTTFTTDITYQTKWRGLGQHAPRGVCPAVRAALTGAGWVVVDGEFENGDVILTDIDHPGIWLNGFIRCQPMGCAGGLILNPRHAREGLRWPQ